MLVWRDKASLKYFDKVSVKEFDGKYRYYENRLLKHGHWTTSKKEGFSRT